MPFEIGVVRLQELYLFAFLEIDLHSSRKHSYLLTIAF